SPTISSTSPHCSSVSRGTGTNGPTGNNRIRAGLIPHPSASHGAAQHAAPQSAHLPSSADHADASQPQSPEFSLQPHFALQEFPLQPARTDDPAQPNPSSFHTARTAPTFLNSQKNQIPYVARRGPRARNAFLSATSPPGLGRRASPRPTVERIVPYSPVALNDIKHLARSMPADGLEAQDVVPPRCGFWAMPGRRAQHSQHFRMRGPAATLGYLPLPGRSL